MPRPRLLDNCPLELTDPTDRMIMVLTTATGILARKAGDGDMVHDLLAELQVWCKARDLTDDAVSR